MTPDRQRFAPITARFGATTSVPTEAPGIKVKLSGPGQPSSGSSVDWIAFAFTPT
jgi:hypothetical protein